MKVQSYKELSDPELISRCLAGDSLAWEALIMRYRRLIFSIPNRFGFSPSDCSDVFQTVCVKLIEHLADLRDDAKVSALACPFRVSAPHGLGVWTSCELCCAERGLTSGWTGF